MNELEDIYFGWLLTKLDHRGVDREVVYVCSLLHNCSFTRRVGLDTNRAGDGIALREEFLRSEEGNYDPREGEDLLEYECTWFEMLLALAIRLSYMYGNTVEGRFLEMVSNMGLDPLFYKFSPNPSKRIEDFDQGFVRRITDRINESRFDRYGHGGLFPLSRDRRHDDQREVEIWEQHNAYFIERLEGVLWTSTN